MTSIAADLLALAAQWWYAWLMLGLTLAGLAVADWLSRGEDPDITDLLEREERYR